MCLREFHTSSCLRGLTTAASGTSAFPAASEVLKTAASGTYAFLAASKVLLLLPQGLVHFQLPQRSYYCCLRDSCIFGYHKVLNAADRHLYISMHHGRLHQIMQILDHGGSSEKLRETWKAFRSLARPQKYVELAQAAGHRSSKE